ncbi:hypothetical protein CHLNCDRAFT_29855 [Chlorella variabilis]|uniref:AMP-dependent synthetase/ligase domain-containing protein n=1 Tax=Chlorella variabilis TaxID=554065 RepID=E1Z5Z3_CHLVA|nr:hypothetical protein CHLNCDRAFT_29855 [Chlorella variabilis]EFN58840.1 hypothetical protein CHLNCDRAFT_29855 [Chlorella variabilis]|eukprot:XP_005850942.1 hypothetical protein CHLNCDRAFT_29855 [Chlorella variabilis]
MVDAVAGAMAHVGVAPHGRAAMFGANSPELMIALQAGNRGTHTVYCVPLYDVLGDHSVEYIIEHSGTLRCTVLPRAAAESTIVFVAAGKLAVLARALGEVVLPVQVRDVIRACGVRVHRFQEFAELGREHPSPPAPPSSDDICTIMYTSGTTGVPKGVLLTHRTLATAVASLAHWMGCVGLDIGRDHGDRYLSFLPLAHIYGRCVEEAFLSMGACIAYWSGEAKGLPADIRASQPAIFCSVPRVFQRFEATTLDKISKAGKAQQALFHTAFNLKLAALKAGAPWDKLASAVFDRLVFRDISRGMLGDQIKLISSGGAPLARHVEEFMRVCGCAKFVQGYGLTETCGATFVSDPDRPDQLYTVGPPQPAYELRLEAVPDMECDPLGIPPRGEVLVRGEGVFVGYHKDEDETRKAVDAEGWFHTGDVGEVTPGGALRIIDRKKNLFKLSQGEYIAVEKIEGVLEDSELVGQVWVHGSHYESCLVAVVVPARRRLEAWAREQGIEGAYCDLCRDSQVRRMLQHELEAVGRKGGLKAFELPKAIHVEEEPFSVANDLLTPTFELRRQQLLKRYSGVVDGLYESMKSRAAGPR